MPLKHGFHRGVYVGGDGDPFLKDLVQPLVVTVVLVGIKHVQKIVSAVRKRSVDFVQAVVLLFAIKAFQAEEHRIFRLSLKTVDLVVKKTKVVAVKAIENDFHYENNDQSI